MRNAVAVVALALGLALLPACGGPAQAPTNGPNPSDSLSEDADEPSDGVNAGAVVSLASEEESGGHFNSMVDMLRGRVSGLQVFQAPNGDISLRIRGLRKSFVGNEEPLLVVDGMPVPTYTISNTLRTMHPSEVASIQVLKDVGSTSAYGPRGVNGVIVIRTKRR